MNKATDVSHVPLFLSITPLPKKKKKNLTSPPRWALGESFWRQHPSFWCLTTESEGREEGWGEVVVVVVGGGLHLSSSGCYPKGKEGMCVCVCVCVCELVCAYFGFVPVPVSQVWMYRVQTGKKAHCQYLQELVRNWIMVQIPSIKINNNVIMMLLLTRE